MVDEHWCGIQRLKLTPDGLRIPGWLWVVDRKVDMSAFQAKYQDLWLLYFDVPPQGPRKDTGFDYNYESPKGSYTDLIARLLWELTVDLFTRNEISLCELLWTQVHQEVGHERLDPLTNENRV